jgi:hypothetical protein
MLCSKPFVSGSLPFGCGQCLPCRISRRRVWVHRMMLESLCHSDSSFVTLTYAPDQLPEGATVVPKHTQDWLKRLRKLVGPLRLRYFLVGEYGELTQRPHYHAAVFGLAQSSQKLVEESWGLGHVLVGSLTKDSCAYIAQYVTKKMTSKADARLGGRHPEFARMSLRPGIGARFLERVVPLLSPRVLELCGGDVPRVLRHGSSDLPLGRYLRSKLRGAVFDEKAIENVVSASLASWSSEMRELFSGAFTGSSGCSSSLSQIVVDRDAQKLLNGNARFEIFKKRGSI